MFDLKVVLMNMQHYVIHVEQQIELLIWEHILYKIKLDCNVIEATKNICCVKCEGIVYSNQMIEKISFGL